MANPLRITLLTLAAVAATLIATFLFLFRTPPGKALVKTSIENALADASGGEVSIGALTGAPPGDVLLEKIRFSENGEIWLAIEEAELDWNPLALLDRKVAISLLRIEGAVLTSAPPEREAKEAKPRGFELPDSLPKLSVVKLDIKGLKVTGSLVEKPVAIDATGSINLGGRAFEIDIEATSTDNRDFVSAHVKRSGKKFDTDIIVKSRADGAIAAIVDADGPIAIEAHGAGPIADYRLHLAAELATFGSLNGEIFGNLDRMEKIGFDVRAQLGPKLQSLARTVGRSVAVTGAFMPKDKGGTIAIDRFQSDLGVVSGTAEWRNRGGALATVTIDANAAFREEWRPDLQRFVGNKVAVAAEIRPHGKLYRATLTVDSPLLDGELRDVTTDLRAFANGPAVIRLLENPALPAFLAGGAEASGGIRLVFDDGVSAAPVTLTTADGGVFTGDVSYKFQSEAFAAKGEFSAPPKVISALSPKLATTGKASGAVDINGTPQYFSGDIDVTTPAIQFGDRLLPAARIKLDFNGMPDAPSGKIAARAFDGSRRLNAAFSKSAEGGWSVRNIAYSGGDFALKGSLSFNPDTNEGVIDLTYRGEDNAEPWPGLTLAGAMTAKGAIARGVASNRLTVRADALSTANLSLEGFTATAEGPAEALTVKASADSIAVDRLAPFEEVSAELTASLGDALRLTVAKLDTRVAGAPLSLSAPAIISFNDGVAIDNLRARIGERGALSFDGVIAEDRWRGKLTARRAPIVSAASVVDIDLDLDTDASPLARGAFTLTSLLTAEEIADLSASFVWDGRSLAVKDDTPTTALNFDLVLPARLLRSPSLSIDTQGPLRGTARYEGRLETVAAFLPPALQATEGALTFSGDASGTLDDPRLSGELALSDGAYTEFATGLSIVNIDATATASGDSKGSRIEFRATGSGPGQSAKTIAAKGVMTLGSEARLDSTMTLNDARLVAGPVTEAEVAGAIKLAGPFADLKADGELKIRRLDARVITPEPTGLVPINVVGVDSEGKSPPTAAPPRAPTSVSYNIHITGDDRIFVRGRGLTSEWRVDATIVGRADEPVVLGTMTLRDGEISFAGRRFEMTRGTIAFDRLSPNNPALNLRAERETQSGITAAIVFEGRAKAPKITLESTPALPKEDIMALILFDKPATELSALESLQVAESLAELGGIGPFGGQGLTGSARQALGLDVLSLDFDQADSAGSTLTVGKYVADGLFVSASQDARGENGSVRVEYEINDSFTIETELRQDGDQTVSANWKLDF